MPDERSLLKMKGSGKGMKSRFQEEEWGGHISDIEQRMLQGYSVRIEHRDTNYLGGLMSPSNCCHVPTPLSFLYVFYLKLKVQSCPERSSTFSLSVFISLYLCLSLSHFVFLFLSHTHTYTYAQRHHTYHTCMHTHTYTPKSPYIFPRFACFLNCRHWCHRVYLCCSRQSPQTNISFITG